MTNTPKCGTCKFRLMIDKHLFHCAAHFGPNGWAYLFQLRYAWRLPQGCKHYIEGDALEVGHQLKPSEFMKVAGARITSEDWAKFDKEAA